MMPADNCPIYSVRSLSFEIGGKRVLDSMSMDARPGEFIAVVGPNGAGKSTLLRHLVRVIPPPKGTVLLYGKCVTTLRQREIAAGVGYVPQSSPVYLPFTALQFVLMGRYPRMNPLVRPDAKEAARALEILNDVGMADFADRRVDMMSGGERQKIFIAAALAQEPSVLLLDEPTTYLDPKHQRDIQRILQSLHRERGTAVVAVTHDINFAARFSDRIVAMKKGAAVYDGPPDGLMRKPRLEELFDTEFDYARGDGEDGVFAFPRRSL